jgi:site-specific recombinase XerD
MSYNNVMLEAEKLLKEYLDYLEIEKNRSPKTRANYERYLKEFFAAAHIRAARDITEARIREFRVALARRLARRSPAYRTGRLGKDGARPLKKITQSYYVIAIRNFLKYLVKRDLSPLAPDKIELPKTPTRQIEVLDYKELERLVESPRGAGARALRDRAILETLFSTGLRLSELCALDRHLDLARGEVTVRGKGDKLRVVFFSPRATLAIAHYLKKRGDALPALFLSYTRAGKPLDRITPRAVERLVAERAAEAGIPKRVHPHHLRHAFATDLLMNGADLRSVQELLGHANVATTQVYTHLTNQTLREAHTAFHGKRRK